TTASSRIRALSDAASRFTGAADQRSPLGPFPFWSFIKMTPDHQGSQQIGCRYGGREPDVSQTFGRETASIGRGRAKNFSLLSEFLMRRRGIKGGIDRPFVAEQ